MRGLGACDVDVQRLYHDPLAAIAGDWNRQIEVSYGCKNNLHELGGSGGGFVLRQGIDDIDSRRASYLSLTSPFQGRQSHCNAWRWQLHLPFPCLWFGSQWFCSCGPAASLQPSPQVIHHHRCHHRHHCHHHHHHHHHCHHHHHHHHHSCTLSGLPATNAASLRERPRFVVLCCAVWLALSRMVRCVPCAFRLRVGFLLISQPDPRDCWGRLDLGTERHSCFMYLHCQCNMEACVGTIPFRFGLSCAEAYDPKRSI